MILDSSNPKKVDRHATLTKPLNVSLNLRYVSKQLKVSNSNSIRVLIYWSMILNTIRKIVATRYLNEIKLEFYEKDKIICSRFLSSGSWFNRLIQSRQLSPDSSLCLTVSNSLCTEQISIQNNYNQANKLKWKARLAMVSDWTGCSTDQGVVARVILESNEREARSRCEVTSTITRWIVRHKVHYYVIAFITNFELKMS